MHLVLSFLFLALPFCVSGSSKCEEFEFPCDNGECIRKDEWCDSNEDCYDESDEKYCKSSTIWSKDPNKCPPNYFRCDSGPCIPVVGKCDGFKSCEDASDEKGCSSLDSSVKSASTTPGSKSATSSSDTRTTEATSATRFTSQRSLVKAGSESEDSSNTPDAMQHSYDVVFSDFQPSEYSSLCKKALGWLLSQRKSDFGWGLETPRALTALYLSDLQRYVNRNDEDLLMIKQLEVQLSLDLSRNGTKIMKQTDLALYINALLASCKDPKNFYGENLVRTLRDSVDTSHRTSTFVNPSVYLTLCLANGTVYDDARKLHEVFLSRNPVINRVDIQALNFLTITCIYRNMNYFVPSQYNGLRSQFLQRMNISGIPGNVYEASLLAQVFHEMKMTLPGLLEFLVSQQEDDGSFGGILATYLALPILAGKSFLQINEHCGQRYSTGLAPIEVLKNTKRRKIHVQYSLKYGYPPEIIESIQMQVAEGINFLDVMRLAEEINPKFRFMLDGSRSVPAIYSIGGIPNDAEKGLFWTLYLINKGRVQGDAGRLAVYPGNVKELIPHNGDEFVFWLKSI